MSVLLLLLFGGVSLSGNVLPGSGFVKNAIYEDRKGITGQGKK